MKAQMGWPLRKNLALFLIVTSNTLFGQVNYDFAAFSGTFTTFTEGVAVDEVEGDNVVSTTIPIGFSFNFFGTAYTQLKASSNGFLTFDVMSNYSHPENFMGNADGPLIAPLWDDLSGEGGMASYILEGVAPGRVFTFQWANWRWGFSANQNISFQVKLYEGTNKVEFIYNDIGGAVSNADASIGITGGGSEFYALLNTTPSTTLDPTATALISTKPASGQVYTFVPNVAPLAPTIPAENVQVTVNDGSGFSFNWTPGNGDFHAVFIKQTSSTSETAPLTDGKYYRPGTSLASGSGYVKNGWFCVYNGTGTSVDITGVQSGLPYQIHVVSYNGLANTQKFNLATAPGNPLNVSSLLVTPGVPVSTVEMYYVGETTAVISLERGNGNGRAIFIKQTSAHEIPPVVDHATYEPNLIFGAGDQVGSSGWFCVANGENPSRTTVSNLQPDTEYRIAIVDYNGTSGYEMYNATTVTDNPLQVRTHENHDPDYIFSASTATYIELSGATELAEFEYINTISESIQLGFAFPFAGKLYTQVRASSNGMLTFNPYISSDHSNLSNDNKLDQTFFAPALAPLWDELDGSSGKAYYKTSGTSGNKIFTIEFRNWKWTWIAEEPGISFQIRLYENSGRIEYIYRPEIGSLDSPSAVIGMAFNDIGEFMALNNATSNATASSEAVGNITTKPAAGQMFTFSLPKRDQTISFDGPLPSIKAGTSLTLAATTTSSLPISYSSSDPSIAEVSGTKVTARAVGTVTITASQPGDVSFNPANPVDQLLTVTIGDQEIMFEELGLLAVGEEMELKAKASSGLPVAYESSNNAIATISGNKLTAVAVGTCTIRASQAGDVNFNSADDVSRTLTVVIKVEQTILFELGDNGIKTYGDESFELDATASSGLSITYESSNPEVATVEGNIVTIIAPGETQITAFQNGNNIYYAAESVSRVLSVEKASQEISVEQVTEKQIGDVFGLMASSSSGLVVSFSTEDEDLASIEGSTVTALSGGTVTIIASQPGNTFYLPADEKQITFVIKKDQLITFEEIDDKDVGDSDFNLSATASSGLTVTFVALTDNISVDGTIVTILAAGEARISAQQTGNLEFNTAEPVDRIFCIAPAKPVITVDESSELPVLTSSADNGNIWYIDGVSTGTTGSSFATNISGTYTAQVIEDGCESELSDEYILIITDIEDPRSVFGMYPNPVDDKFIVNVSLLHLDKPAQIMLIDLSGKILNEWSGTDVISCDISMHKAGDYLVKVYAGSRTFSKKIVKK